MLRGTVSSCAIHNQVNNTRMTSSLNQFVIVNGKGLASYPDKLDCAVDLHVEACDSECL